MMNFLSLKTRNVSAAVAAIAMASALVPAGAVAQDQSSDWAFQVTPYVWMLGMGGSIRPLANGPTVEIDSSFHDVLDSLDAAAFLSGMARKDRLVLLADITYSKSSKSGEIAPGVAAKGKERQSSLTVAAGYEVMDEQGVTLDLLAGARLWNIRASINVPAIGVQETPTFSFVDPLLAVRVSKDFAEKWSTSFYADAGGFGVGSNKTWEMVGVVNYHLRKDIYFSAAYRHLALDYRHKGAVIDIHMSGPLLGATWQF
jgi:hypothetical protein